jgi:mRNA interferase HigB
MFTDVRTWGMKVLNRRGLREYCTAHPEAAASLGGWWQTAQESEWSSFSDIRQAINSADQVGDLVIFNIRGNHYRLVTWINYDDKYVVMKWFGPHREYDRGAWK